MAIGTNFEISGEATATAGYNIDDEKFGFKNDSESNIKIELVAEDSKKKPGEMMDGWYGSIELKDFQIIIDSGEEDSELLVTADGDPESVRSKLYVKPPDIVATLKNGPLWLRIFDAPSNKADLIAHIEDDEDGDYDSESHDDGNDVGLDLDGQGIMVGYDTSGLDIALGITSDEPYDTDDEGSFVVSADLGVDVGPAELMLSFVQGLPNEDDADPEMHDDTGVGALLKTTFGSIELSAGADVHMTGDEDTDPSDDVRDDMNVDVGANAEIALTPNTDFTSKYLYSTKKDVASDVEVELTDDNGLVQNLKMSLKWGLFDITGGDSADDADADMDDEADLLVKGSLDYELEGMGGTITPGTTVSVDQVNGGDAKVGLEVRAVLTDAIPATEFGLKWKTAQLVDSGEKASESGIVTLWTKISY